MTVIVIYIQTVQLVIFFFYLRLEASRYVITFEKQHKEF